MALEKQNIEFIFNKGMDRKTKEELVAVGELIKLKNGTLSKYVSSKGMSSSISKRYGYTPFSRTYYDTSYAAQTQTEGKELITRDNEELLLLDKLKTLSLSKTNGKWNEKGISSSFTVNSRNVVRNNYDQYMFDMDCDDNYEIIAWRDERNTAAVGSIRVSIYDSKSKNYLMNDYELLATAGDCPRCAILNGKFFVFYVDVSTVKVRRLVLASGLTWEAATTVGVTHSLDGFDIAKISTTKLAILYCLSGTGVVVTQMDEDKNFSGSGGLPAVYSTGDTMITSGLGLCIHFDSTNNYLWIGYTKSGTYPAQLLRGAIITTAHAVIQAPTTLDTLTGINDEKLERLTIGLTSSTTAKYYYNFCNTLLGTTYNYNIPYINEVSFTTAGAVGARTLFLNNVWIASKTYSINNRVHFLVHRDWKYYGVAPYTDLYSTIFLVDDLGNFRAIINRNECGENYYLYRYSAQPKISVTGNKYKIAIPSTSSVSSEIQTYMGVPLRTVYTVKSGIAVLELDYDSDYCNNTSYNNDVLHISGGQTLVYDRNNIVESYFNQKPIITSYAAVATGGYMSDGVYSVCYLYEYFDTNGNRYLSEVSDVVTVTLSAGTAVQRISLVVPTIIPTLKEATKINFIVFRTKASGTIFYRDSNISTQYNNNKAVRTMTIYASNTDTNIGNYETIYTTGDILENQAPPAPRIIATYKDRLMVLSGNEIWYSKVITRYTGIAFNENLKFPKLKDLGGDITQIAEMDGKLFIFKANCIFVTTGEGANDAGQNEQFSIPELLASDIGCSEPRGFGLFTNGIIFKSTKGIWLLDRSMNLSPIGSKFECYNGEKIISTVIMKNISHIRFLTSSNNVIIYDYNFNEWYYFTNHVGVSAVLYDDKFCHLKSDGYVFYENSALYQDNGTNIELEIETGWLKFAGIQAYQRIYKLMLLGEKMADHDLAIRAYYDYNALRYNDYTYDCATKLIGSDLVYQVMVKPKYQKCESIKLNIKDTSSTGEGYTLSSLIAEVGLKKGIHKPADLKIATPT